MRTFFGKRYAISVAMLIRTWLFSVKKTQIADQSFLSFDALRINQRRLESLAELGLEIEGKRVLEVGAGAGLLTTFFLDRSCDVLVTEGRKANVEDIERNLSRLDFKERLLGILELDLDDLNEYQKLKEYGPFDIIFCYGALYHCQYPDLVLRELSELCTGIFLLETVCGPGEQEFITREETALANQSIHKVGSRPSLHWINQTLLKDFKFLYHPKKRPNHPDFPIHWAPYDPQVIQREIFIASRKELANENLIIVPPSDPLL